MDDAHKRNSNFSVDGSIASSEYVPTDDEGSDSEKQEEDVEVMKDGTRHKETEQGCKEIRNCGGETEKDKDVHVQSQGAVVSNVAEYSQYMVMSGGTNRRGEVNVESIATISPNSPTSDFSLTASSFGTASKTEPSQQQLPPPVPPKGPTLKKGQGSTKSRRFPDPTQESEQPAITNMQRSSGENCHCGDSAVTFECRSPRNNHSRKQSFDQTEEPSPNADSGDNKSKTGTLQKLKGIFTRKTSTGSDGKPSTPGSRDTHPESGYLSGDSSVAFKRVSEDSYGYVSTAESTLHTHTDSNTFPKGLLTPTIIDCGEYLSPRDVTGMDEHAELSQRNFAMIDTCTVRNVPDKPSNLLEEYLSPRDVLVVAEPQDNEPVYECPTMLATEEHKKINTRDEKEKKKHGEKEKKEKKNKEDKKSKKPDTSYYNTGILRKRLGGKKEPLPPVPIEKDEDLASIRRKTLVFKQESLEDLEDSYSQGSVGSPVTSIAKPKHYFGSIDDVPDDLCYLSKDEVAECLTLIGINDRKVAHFLQEKVDGFLLMHLNDKAMEQLGLDALEICKVNSFTKGWRPGKH